MKGIRIKKRLKHMVEPDKNCQTGIEDVAWLCSLQESEIDMLVGLKLLIIQRAKMIGCKQMADKFNLKMIRAIGMLYALIFLDTGLSSAVVSEMLRAYNEMLANSLVLMEHLKSQIKESSVISNAVRSASILDACNLLKCSNEVNANIEELNTSLGADILTFIESPPTSKRKKQKVESDE
ncbi:uncharacterized protein HKW66_Vig0116440 [Vigna angularis]|uniref:Uncharacterized protein n=1 Tax=Phaseolus angularis TaxID=3914 RepID=A0A8T0KZR4_PHAAN|nr:uncharacterized protein HKW66_Vig0116440 [Vigna angularis]